MRNTQVSQLQLTLKLAVTICLWGIVLLFSPMANASYVGAQISGDYCDGYTAVPGQPITCTNSFSSDNNAYGGGVSDSAVAGYGSLGASSAVTAYDTLGEQGVGGGSVTAQFNDSFTASVLTGTLVLDVTVDGDSSVITTQGNGHAEGTAVAQLTWGCAALTTGCAYTQVLGDGYTTIDDSIPIQNGQGDIFMSLLASASCDARYGATCAANAAFLNTVLVTGYSIYDSNGNLLSNAFITADSGTDYNHVVEPVAAVPEPSSLLLLGTGALSLFGPIRRKLLR